MKPHEKLILLTNDDGIESPGLRAAAEALSKIGWVTVVAPREQWTGAGRSMPHTTNGTIHAQHQQIGQSQWNVYAVDGSPAQVVQHGLVEIMPREPDLVVAGINYGENLGSGITVSGTVGAALEAASFGIPGLAVSLETPREYHLSHSSDIDFSAAAYFTQLFAKILLTTQRPADIDVLKVDIPATPDTAWRVTRRLGNDISCQNQQKKFQRPNR